MMKEQNFLSNKIAQTRYIDG